ncbi:MAG: preprotein translocase subunit SecA [Clostridia bacterium]
MLIGEIIMWPFGSENKHNLKQLEKTASKVEALEKIYASKTDEELKATTQILKDRYAKGESLNSLLPDAFAVNREASWRVLGMKHFHVQILGGIALHQGRIAEMKTGEGKTLVCTLPAYLNALAGNGVHIVTVNEYLAKFHAEWMGKVHKFLGLTVGVVYTGLPDDLKRKAYDCDITYSTNNELGFDYLRDNMATNKSQRFQRGFNFAIVDEVDSILIDEARTPLIISGRGMKSSEVYHSANNFAKTLVKNEDFEIEPKQKSIHLTESGTIKAEKYFKVENLSDVNCIELNHHIMNALKANFIMKIDENYIVKDDEVVIVDEFTGRLMQGRRFSEGLHQAIEAKENVKIKDEDKTLATITFQNLFRLYKKLSGMTGTAKTEESEFNGIYKLDVVCIPPNKINKRIDEPDIVYRSIKGKQNAIVQEVKERHALGQPMLIGTTTIEKSEELSKLLRREKIEHAILNAKNHERESEIVAQAGRFGNVTISTNMAGRGTDILLGGNPEFMAKKKMKDENFTDEQISFATSYIPSNDENLQLARDTFNKHLADFKKITDEEKAKVISVGGLHIIGTERHESRRIDNQLRGRAGRQGDPGSSIFFLSLEDDLIMRFGGEKLQKIADFLKIDDNTPLQMRLLSKQIENAQKRIEAQNYSVRRTILQFDDVMNAQRTIIYGERNKVLDGINVHDQVMQMYPDVVGTICNTYLNADKPYFEWKLDGANNSLEDKLFAKETNLLTPEFVEDCDIPDVVEKIVKIIDKRYNEKVSVVQEAGLNFEDFERYVLLRMVDNHWMDHIDQMTILRNEIGLRAYGNQDPVVAYKREGFELFDNMIDAIKVDTSSALLNSHIKFNVTPNASAPNTNQKPVTVEALQKPNRNSPCPCGSGKKYKNCCGK